MHLNLEEWSEYFFHDESGISGLASKFRIQNTPFVTCVPLRYCVQTNEGWSLYKELCMKASTLRLCDFSCHMVDSLKVKCTTEPLCFFLSFFLLCLRSCTFSFVHFIKHCCFYSPHCSADAWLSAAVDCLEFLPDQLVVEVSRGLAKCPEETAQYKRLLYSILIQHYGQTDYPPLFSNHVFDIHGGISELLGKTSGRSL